MNLDGLKLAEDLAVGDVVTFGTHEVTDAEILEFARSWDPQWFHLDVDAAAAGPYGGLIASGLHTMAIYHRLYVDSTHWAAIAGRGLPGVRFLRPVRPGDRLTGSLRIVELSPEPDRNRALVRTEGELRNADGKPVLTMSTDAYLHLSRAALD